MLPRQAPPPARPGTTPDRRASAAPAIERSADPIQLLSNILEAAGAWAGQWGDETPLHLRVAALWARMGRKPRALQYLMEIVARHLAQAARHGQPDAKHRVAQLQWLANLIMAPEAAPDLCAAPSKGGGKPSWFARFGTGKKQAPTVQLPDDEKGEVSFIADPTVPWLQQIYRAPIPTDARDPIARIARAVGEHDTPEETERRIAQMIDTCDTWRERRFDATPVLVHDLDDIAQKVTYSAVRLERQELLVRYVERCITVLQAHPQGCIPNIRDTFGGFAYLSKALQRDDPLQQALSLLPNLSERTRTWAALGLAEVLMEPIY